VAQAPAASAEWTRPETVATLSRVPPVSGLGSIHLATNATGDAIVAWSQETTHGSSRDMAVAVTRRRGGPWSAPVRLSSAGSSAQVPAVAISPTGEAIVVWAEASNHHRRKRTVVTARGVSPTRGWGRAHVLASSEEVQSRAPRAGPDPQVAIDGAGDATVVFNYGRTSDREFIELTSRSRGGQWQRAVPVAQTAYCSETQVALGAKGEILLAWNQAGRASPTTLVWVEALVLNRRHHAESAPEVLSSKIRRSYGIDLASNATGDGVVVWGLEWGPEGAGGARVEASTRTAGQRFGRAVVLLRSGARSYPGGVVIDRAGTATALISTTIAQASTHPRGGFWSTPAPISPPPAEGSVEAVKVAENARGDLAAVWTTKLAPAPGQHFASAAIAATLGEGAGQWQPAALISPVHSRTPAVSLLPDGRALAVWEQESTARIEAAEYTP